MINTLLSICKFIEDNVSDPPYSFEGEVQIGHANYLDSDAKLPKILVNDEFWTWQNIQFGSFPAKKIDPLEIQCVAGSKLHALEMVTWIVGKELLGDSGNNGILLHTEIPLWRFAGDKKTIIGEIDPNTQLVLPSGEIVFGNNPLPDISFSASVDAAEREYMYTISFSDVLSYPTS